MLAAIGTRVLHRLEGQLIALPVEAEVGSARPSLRTCLRRLDNGGVLRLKDVGRVSLGQRNYGRGDELQEALAVGLYHAMAPTLLL